jgi:hypothetical protein
MSGVLAVWNNCAPGAEPEYERWYLREHLPERLGVAGFRRGWRYEAPSANPRYFTYYEVDEPQVLLSPGYLERLQNPTPWTRKIMTSVFRDTSRTVCKVSLSLGAAAGGRVVTMRWDARAPMESVMEMAYELHALGGVARVQVWSATEAQTPATEETKVRGGADERIGGALVVDCIGDSDARAVNAWLASTWRGRIDEQSLPVVESYSFLCMHHAQGGAA